jgi:5'-3' exonuclease
VSLLLPARNLDSYHEVLYKRMDKLLNVTQPRKSVMLAIDGPAPLAKLMTQRDRRKVRDTGLGGWVMCCARL